MRLSDQRQHSGQTAYLGSIGLKDVFDEGLLDAKHLREFALNLQGSTRDVMLPYDGPGVGNSSSLHLDGHWLLQTP